MEQQKLLNPKEGRKGRKNEKRTHKTKQVPSGGLKPNHMENYIKCECSALQLKERNPNGRKAKTNYYYPQKTHLKK